MTSIIIDKRYCGPPNSGNGGYVCGRLARHIGDPHHYDTSDFVGPGPSPDPRDKA